VNDHRISIVLPVNYLGIGGAEQQLLELVRGLDKTRFQPVVVSLYPGGPLEGEVAQIPGAELVSVNREGRHDFWVMTRMLSLLRQKKVDIIQPFLTPATLFGLLPALINRTPVKIVTERSGARTKERFTQKFYKTIEDFLTRFADWIIPNSTAGRDHLVDRGINPDRIKVIYNGINFERLTPDRNKVAQLRKQMKLPPGGKVVGVMANLRPDKDHATFLQGARIMHQVMPETRFAILGDGPLRLDIENMVRELDMEPFVTFFGHQRDIASYVSCFDVACLCSNDVEGCSNATLEAMALGKSVVVTDVGGNREVVDDGKTGFLVPARSPQVLADVVLNCLRNPDRARDIGKRARKMVLTRFSLTRMVHDYEQLYEQAMQLKQKG
jgi:glycosyltransferase involved in cell wall biosynthesis